MSVFEKAIGLIAPPDCLGCGIEGKSLCASCSAVEILPYGERCFGCGAISTRCRTCQRCRRGGAPRYVWVATDYADLAKEILQVYKFSHHRSCANQLAELMHDILLTYNSDSDLDKTDYLVVGVPTATTRVRERGFDHAKLLAQRLASLQGLDHSPALVRLGQSRQLGAKRQTRLSQKDHSYYVRDTQAVAGRNILLIDDVVTTGATLKIAAKALRAAGAKRIDGLVFAKRI